MRIFSQEHRKKLSVAAKRREKSSSYKAKRRRITKKWWSDPEWAEEQRKKIIASLTPEIVAIVKEKNTVIGNDPAERKRRSLRFKRLWANRTWAARMRKALKAAWTSERCAKRKVDVRKHYQDHPGRRRKLSRSRRKLFLNKDFAERHGRRLKESPNAAEKSMMKILRKLKLNYRFQQSMFGYFPDFLLPKLKVVIECDGIYWHSKLSVRRRDRRKDRAFEKAGYKVIRISSEEVVKNPEKVLQQLKALLKRKTT